MEGDPKLSLRKSYLDLSAKGRKYRLKRLKSIVSTDKKSPKTVLLNDNCTANDHSQTEPMPSCSEQVSNFAVEEEWNFDQLSYADTGAFNYEESDSDIDPGDSCTKGESLTDFSNKLKFWSTHYAITQVALTALLCLLKTHPCLDKLPSDSRTLLDTPVSLPVKELSPGHYCHIGLAEGIKRVWSQIIDKVVLGIDILIGIDGLPLFNSTQGDVWPIMASICNIPSVCKKVFPVGIYHGKKNLLAAESFCSRLLTKL